MKMRRFIKDNIILIVVSICAVGLHFLLLDKIPRGWHVDEAGMAYDAWCIANYGVDRYRYSYPVYLVNFGGGQSAMYAYMVAVLIKIFGFSHYLVRIPSAIISLMVLFCGIGFLRIIGCDKKAQIIWAFLYTILPYFFMAGRIGLDCNLMLGTVAVFMMCMALALKNNKLRYYVLAGLSCGIVLYTYAISYLVMIIFLGLLFLLLLYFRKLTFKRIACFCIPLTVLAMPLVIVQVINILNLETLTIWKFTFVRLPGYRSAEIGIPRINHLIEVLKSVFLYDWLGYNTNSKYLTLYCISIPLFIIGFVNGLVVLVKSIKSRKFDICNIILLWFTAEIIMGIMLGGDGTNANKMNGIFFSVLYYIVKGILVLYNLAGNRIVIKRTVLCNISAVYLICAGSFFYYYYNVEKNKTQLFMCNTFSDAVEFIESNTALSDKDIYVGNAIETYIYYLISTLQSPYEYSIDSEGRINIDKYRFYLPDQPVYDACYIILESSSNYIENLYPLGLQVMEMQDGSFVAYPSD